MFLEYESYEPIKVDQKNENKKQNLDNDQQKRSISRMVWEKKRRRRGKGEGR